MTESEADKSMMKILNDMAKRGGGTVVTKDHNYIVLDEKGNEAYRSPLSESVYCFMEIRVKWGIPFSGKPRKQRRGKR